MFSAFVNSLKITELRNKIFFTLVILAICRVAANIPCPGIDPQALKDLFAELQNSKGGAGGFIQLFDLFSGGALQNFAVGALGIMPYISASIIMQLMTPVIPQLERMQQEGDQGRQKIIQITRYMTLVICVVQGFMLAKGMLNPGQLLNANLPDVVTMGETNFIMMTIVILTCGTMILMWLGEQITDKGIGNGASLIITVNIIQRLPSALYGMWTLLQTEGEGVSRFTYIHVLILLGVFVAVTAFTVRLTLGVRRIPIQHARGQAAGGRAAGGQNTFLPLRVNYANVMPIIFADAILMFPPLLFGAIQSLAFLMPFFVRGSAWFMAIYAAMIILFSFFWVSTQFNPIKIADDLKRSGGYIPGVRPGKPTADFLDWTMTRVTVAGALFLAILALFPMIVMVAFRDLNLNYTIAGFFGSASLLIIVGVMLDTMRQIESHLVMHNYDGFMQQGRMRSRRSGSSFGR